MSFLTSRLYGLLTLLWVAVMLVLTLTPAREMPRTPEWELLSFDTAAHAGVFAVLAGLAWLWARRQAGLARRAGLLVLAGCVAFGALIEVLQYAMHAGRHAEWSDLLGDTIGAALALGLLLALAGRARRGPTALALAALLLPRPAAAQPEPDLPRARRTIEALAAEPMHGRGYVQQGEHRAAAYLRGRLRQLGLQPLAPDYTQPFTLDVNTFPGQLTLTVTKGGGTTYRLRPGLDFIVAPASGGAARPLTTLLMRPDTLVFTDTAAQRRWQQTLRLLATRKHAFVALALTPAEEQRLVQLPAGLRQLLDSAAARISLVPKLTASLAPTQLPTVRLEALRTLPVWSALGAAGGSAPAMMTLRLDADLRHDYPTQNLAAVVRGSAQPDSFLVVSAHYDHLGMMGSKTYFPGANDNASGVALLLELAAHYARPENRPTCSVVFLLFGAEEAGLLGSAYFVRHPLVPLANIKFLLNLDLLGTGEEGATVVNGRVHAAAFARLAALNAAHHYLPRLTARGPAANSDHFPFSEAGVPAFFLYTRGGSRAYHDVNDRPAALSLAGFAGAYGLARDFLDGLGAAPQR